MTTEAWWAVGLDTVMLLMILACVLGPMVAERLIAWDRRRPGHPWAVPATSGDSDVEIEASMARHPAGKAVDHD